MTVINIYVKILYQTPDTLFVYWDIADSDRENYIKHYGENFFNITRPVLIVQNDTGNRHSPTVIAAAITSQTGKARLPTHINIAGGSVGLSKDSVILLEQIRTIDKKRLREHMGKLDDAHMHLVNEAIAVSFGLVDDHFT